jgi:hypothetical protein
MALDLASLLPLAGRLVGGAVVRTILGAEALRRKWPVMTARSRTLVR